ncbi:type II secretion system protein [Tautonia plasticadhaerens]|uniref:Uncharacterized protein n=1 Tax=Tautonia plasticadhaerens TaxID=2527974 RepID=A0A518H500_9BACT|nr:type II secretion system protein [Tautonia plasticadhaerens]QDV35901.1 hypothetical protein ElP_38090 [Tautonia plasticadhaerens]
MALASRRPRPSGLTLTELLVVMAIILLVSAATLPTVLASLSERDVSEAASTVQAVLTATQDRAAGSGQPAGIRLLPDPTLNDTTGTGIIASNRMVPLEVLPNYAEGEVIPGFLVSQVAVVNPNATIQVARPVLMARMREEELASVALGLGAIPAPPTAWHYNIRQGDAVRLANSSIEYRVAGPMWSFQDTGGNIVNPERFVNRDAPLAPGASGTPGTNQYVFNPSSTGISNFAGREFLYVVNGRDDPPPVNYASSNGYIDEAFDGVDNNGDGVIDPGFNGIDDDGDSWVDEADELFWNADAGAPLNPAGPTSSPGSNLLLVEYELDSFVGQSSYNTTPTVTFSFQGADTFFLHGGTGTPTSYSITRRPFVSSGAREVGLTGAAVIDLTTAAWGVSPVAPGAPERSRVPIDPATGYVDLLFYPDGRVVPATPYQLNRVGQFSFYHLWIAERDNLFEPDLINRTAYPYLPVPREASPAVTTRVLEGERRMVTISAKTGNASVSPIAEFSTTAVAYPGFGAVPAQDVPYVEAIRQQRGE